MEFLDRDGSIQPPNPKGKTRGALFLLAAYLFILLALSIDLVFWTGKSLLAEGPPEFGDLHPFRTGLIALASALTVLGLSPRALGRSVLPAGRDSRNQVRTSASQRGEGLDLSSSAIQPGIAHWGILALSWAIVLLFILAPDVFLQLQNEDRLVENGSALLLFLASLIFLRVFWAYRKSGLRKTTRYAWTALFFSAAFFLIAMEEVSWFQRVLSLETPAVLETSPRDELNLHNLATDLVENLYYGGAFIFLVLIPYLDLRTSFFRSFAGARGFSPSVSILLAAALPVAYNFDMWNILFTQLAFFLTFFILFDLAWAKRRVKPTLLYLVMLILTMVISQSLFLSLGDRFIQGWEVTEYKELLLPIAFLLYAIEVDQRASTALETSKQTRSESTSEKTPAR